MISLSGNFQIIVFTHFWYTDNTKKCFSDALSEESYLTTPGISNITLPLSLNLTIIRVQLI